MRHPGWVTGLSPGTTNGLDNPEGRSSARIKEELGGRGGGRGRRRKKCVRTQVNERAGEGASDQSWLTGQLACCGY